MDDFTDSGPAKKDDVDQPIPFDDSDNIGDTNISHSPLNLGNSQTDQAAGIGSVRQNDSEPVARSSDRITGVKTFFTKLHAGSINFLDEQITNWLKANPDITIKHTSTATGDVVSKKTEPNIIVTIWY